MTKLTRSIAERADRWGMPPSQFWLREQRPERVVDYDADTGLWNVYGYPEAVQILSEPRTFSSDTQRLVPDLAARDELSAGNLVQMDPPQHRKLRALVSHAFTPKVVADLEPRISLLTHELLEAVPKRGELELVADLAYPLPVIVIAELLGVPSGDRQLFKHWVDKMFENDQQVSLTKPTEEQKRQFDEAMTQVRHLRDYLSEHATERRSRPREDLLTKLVQAEVDGARLSDDEVANFAMVLLRRTGRRGDNRPWGISWRATRVVPERDGGKWWRCAHGGPLPCRIPPATWARFTPEFFTRPLRLRRRWRVRF